MRGSLLLALASMALASARLPDSSGLGISLGFNGLSSFPPQGHKGRDHFRAVSARHDYDSQRHAGPNPKARSPKFSRHPYF